MIMDAALRAWGRESYKKTSLAELAAELRVTKAALYRYFPSKEALLAALEERFFDEYSAALKLPLSEAAEGRSELRKRVDFVYYRALAPFAADEDRFSFFFFHLLHAPCPFRRLHEELSARGAPGRMEKPGLDDEGLALNFAYITGMHALAYAHQNRGKPGIDPRFHGRAALAAAREVALCGLRMRPAPDCDYGALERLAALRPEEAGPGQPLLESVARAVAEAGLWNATMDMVAAGAGLSKSGLYAHFRSREEALSSLFSAEFERIMELSAERLARVEEGPCRLYVSMATTANYLRARPDVLAAMRWVMAQHIDIRYPTARLLPPNGSFLEAEAEAGRCVLIGGSLDLTLHWMHFLVVDLLSRIMEGGASPSIEASLRKLHALVLGGIEGALSG